MVESTAQEFDLVHDFNVTLKYTIIDNKNLQFIIFNAFHRLIKCFSEEFLNTIKPKFLFLFSIVIFNTIKLFFKKIINRFTASKIEYTQNPNLYEEIHCIYSIFSTIS